MAKPKKGAKPKPPTKAASTSQKRGLQPEHLPEERLAYIEDAIAMALREGINRGQDFDNDAIRLLQREAEADWNDVSRDIVPVDDQARVLREDAACVWVLKGELRTRVPHMPERDEVGDFIVRDLREVLMPPEPLRGGYAARALTFLRETENRQPDVVARWIEPLLEEGPPAVLQTLADMILTADVKDLETNTLSWLGNRVSYYLRRAVLLRELEAADWNLGAVGEKLRMGGAGNVTKVIRDLELTAELEAARAQGKAKRGVKRR